MKNYWTYCLIYFGMLICSEATGQGVSRLIGDFSFDNCTINDRTGNTPIITSGAPLVCDCGINGEALVFDGSNQYVDLSESSAASLFTRIQFSISFYFRPTGNAGQMVLFSKKDNCLSTRGFSIKYNAASREIIAEFEESSNNRLTLRAILDPDRCWHHIVVNRASRRHQLYVNNVLRQDSEASQVLDMTNEGEFLVGSGPCVGTTDVNFRGLMSNILVHSPEIRELEVNALFRDQDKLQNRDTTIFLGTEFTARPNENCGISYSWFPEIGVSNPQISNPVLSPSETTTFIYSVNYSGCIARDTLIVTVIDPSLLDCRNLPMPNAFTPNSDGLNEGYFISNPFTFDELISFEIFERNGGKVFSTNERFEAWDGTFKGKPMPHGVYLYMIKYKCGAEEIVKHGSFVLIR